MRGTKEPDLLCWLGPAELVNFIKWQINVSKGWSALGEVALSSWLGLCPTWFLHPSKPWVTLAVPAQQVWVLARGTGPSHGAEGNPVQGELWHSRAGTAPVCLQNTSHLLLPALLHPTPTRNTCVTPLGQSLPIFAFTATQILSRTHP